MYMVKIFCKTFFFQCELLLNLVVNCTMKHNSSILVHKLPYCSLLTESLLTQFKLLLCPLFMKNFTHKYVVQTLPLSLA